MFFENRTNRKLAADRAELARQVGGIEHQPGSGTRPRFGFFPAEAPGAHGTPFDYAIEFSRSGYDVMAFEKKHTRAEVSGAGMIGARSGFEQFVQVRVPPTPFLWLGGELYVDIEPRLQELLVPELSGGAHKFFVCSPDPQFARAVVTPSVAAWFAQKVALGNAQSAFFRPVVLEAGTVRIEPHGKRLTGEDVVADADLLIEFVRQLPQQTWSRQS